MQHLEGKEELTTQILENLVIRNGREICKAQMEKSDEILNNAGIDPQTLLPRNDGVLEQTITLPADDSFVDGEEFADVIALYNEKQAKTKKENETDSAEPKDSEERENQRNQIKAETIKKVERDPDSAIVGFVDEVGVKHQNEERRVNGKQAVKSTVNVENTVIRVKKGNMRYTITATSMHDAFKLFLAFALENGLKEGAPLIFFSDGAQNIRNSIETYLSFYPYSLYLDWFHLQKRVKELVSSAFKGKKGEKHEIIDHIKEILWAGNVDEAIDYINELSSELTKSESKREEIISYLKRKAPFIYCYALRKELGYVNASSPAEKTNDLIVARRQKHNGMSWSYSGSGSLALISALEQNNELDSWIHTHQIHFTFGQAA